MKAKYGTVRNTNQAAAKRSIQATNGTGSRRLVEIDNTKAVNELGCEPLPKETKDKQGGY